MPFFKVYIKSRALRHFIFLSGDFYFKCIDYISKYYNKNKGAIEAIRLWELLKSESIEEREDARTAGR